jgi:hypothetical protein
MGFPVRYGTVYKSRSVLYYTYYTVFYGIILYGITVYYINVYGTYYITMSVAAAARNRLAQACGGQACLGHGR